MHLLCVIQGLSNDKEALWDSEVSCPQGAICYLDGWVDEDNDKAFLKAWYSCGFIVLGVSKVYGKQ